MKRDNRQVLRDYLEKAREKTNKKRLIAALSLIVGISVVLNMMQPASTLVTATVCGFEEHAHAENCFLDGELICGLPEHIHTDACHVKVEEEEPTVVDSDGEDEAVVAEVEDGEAETVVAEVEDDDEDEVVAVSEFEESAEEMELTYEGEPVEDEEEAETVAFDASDYDPLEAYIFADAEEVVPGTAIALDFAHFGGAEPANQYVTVRQGDAVLLENAEVDETVTVVPEGDGDIAVTLTVIDSLGNGVTAEQVIPGAKAEEQAEEQTEVENEVTEQIGEEAAEPAIEDEAEEQTEVAEIEETAGDDTDSIEEPAEELTEEPVEEIIEETKEEIAEETAEDSTEKAADEHTEEPAEEIIEEIKEEIVEETTEDSTEETAEDSTEEAAEENADESTEDSTKESVEQPADEPAEDSAEEDKEEVADEPAEEDDAEQEETAEAQDEDAEEQAEAPDEDETSESAEEEPSEDEAADDAEEASEAIVEKELNYEGEGFALKLRWTEKATVPAETTESTETNESTETSEAAETSEVTEDAEVNEDAEATVEEEAAEPPVAEEATGDDAAVEPAVLKVNAVDAETYAEYVKAAEALLKPVEETPAEETEVEVAAEETEEPVEVTETEAADTEDNTIEETEEQTEVETEEAPAFAEARFFTVTVAQGEAEFLPEGATLTLTVDDDTAVILTAGEALETAKGSWADYRGEVVGYAIPTVKEEAPAEEPVEEAPAYAEALSYEGDGFTVTLTCDAEAQIPADAALDVREILPGTEEYSLYSAQTDATLDEAWHEAVAQPRFFDITILYNEEEFQPAVPVSVRIDLDEAVSVPEDDSAEVEDVQAIHFADEGAQLLSADSQQPEEVAEAVSFDAESFSVYGIVPTAALTKKVITAEGETFDIRVTYTKDAQIPEGATLAAAEITAESDPEKYASYTALSAAALTGDPEAALQLARLFDISIVDAEGAKAEPQDEVTVKIAYAQADPTGDVQVIHFAEDSETLEIAPDVITPETGSDERGMDTVEFVTESFSMYTIVTLADIDAGLDGQSYVIATTYNNVAMLATEQTRDNIARLNGKTLTDVRDNAYCVDADATEWTFTLFEGGKYVISTEVGDQTKYLHFDRPAEGSNVCGVSLSDQKQALMVTKNNNGEVLISHDGYGLNLDGGEVDKGFLGWDGKEGDGTASQYADNRYMKLLTTVPNAAKLEEIVDNEKGFILVCEKTAGATWSYGIEYPGLQYAALQYKNDGQWGNAVSPDYTQIPFTAKDASMGDRSTYPNIAAMVADKSIGKYPNETNGGVPIWHYEQIDAGYRLYTTSGGTKTYIREHPNGGSWFGLTENVNEALVFTLGDRNASGSYRISSGNEWGNFFFCEPKDVETYAIGCLAKQTRNEPPHNFDALALVRLNAHNNNGWDETKLATAWGLLWEENGQYKYIEAEDATELILEKVPGKENTYYVSGYFEGDRQYRYIYINDDYQDGEKYVYFDRADQVNQNADRSKYEITITPTEDGKAYYIYKGDRYLNLFRGNKDGGFGTWVKEDGNNEKFLFLKHSDITNFETVHTGEKVSVSQVANKDLDSAKRVIIYRTIYDDEKKEYQTYAIDGNGRLIRAYDHGDEVTAYSLVGEDGAWWDVEVRDNGYVNFYNAVTGNYLCPQADGSIVVTGEAPGVQLRSKIDTQNKDFVAHNAAIIKWQDSSYYGLKLGEGNATFTTSVVTDTEFEEFSFAAEFPARDFKHKVETVTNPAIQVTMYDFGEDIYAAKNHSAQVIADTIGFVGYTNGNTSSGLMTNTLDNDGWPTSIATRTSLQALFESGNDIYPVTNTMFLQSIYDETGYYEYSAFNNFAHLNKDTGIFDVYKEIGVPADADNFFYKRGNFMPFNDLTAERIANTVNVMDGDGNQIAIADPTLGETLYKTDKPDYYFGMKIETSFQQPKGGVLYNGDPIVFEFNGDDDLWVYLDDTLVLDIGGDHDALSGSINFTTGEVIVNSTNFKSVYADQLGDNKLTIQEMYQLAGTQGKTTFTDSGTFADYTTHTLKVFYMERGAAASNLHIKFNLQTVTPGAITLKKELDKEMQLDYGTQPEFYYQIFKKNGTAPLGFDDIGDANQGKAIKSLTKNGKVDATNDSFQTKTISGTAYTNLITLKPNEEWVLESHNVEDEYYFKEIKVNEYDVSVNGTAITESGGSYPSGNYKADGSKVIYHNGNRRAQLEITKIYDREYTTEPEFEFQIWFKDESRQYVYYKDGVYGLRDAEGKYLKNSTFSETEYVTCNNASATGKISGIKPGQTIVIPNLLPGTEYMVMEVDEDNLYNKAYTVDGNAVNPISSANADGAVVGAVTGTLPSDSNDPTTRVFVGKVEDTNTPNNTIYLRKTDNSDTPKPLEGAEFTLSYLKANDTFEAIMDGTEKKVFRPVLNSGVAQIALGALSYKTVYKLEEIKAPDGYNLSSNAIYFEVGADGTISLYTKEGVTDANGLATISEDGKTITVKNTPGVRLPDTGGMGTLIYTVGGLLLIAVAGLLLILRRKEY